MVLIYQCQKKKMFFTLELILSMREMLLTSQMNENINAGELHSSSDDSSDIGCASDIIVGVNR